MTLEDAHGMLLPLPLELVVSWQVRKHFITATALTKQFLQMLDSILLGHFRAVIGEKKVQNQEFEIEDSMARSILSRKDPWSQICRPGRKIEMSMIFKDVSKTSVVCPKCDTISKEEKGVQVEWLVFCCIDLSMWLKTCQPKS
jgi:hypothetical protein